MKLGQFAVVTIVGAFLIFFVVVSPDKAADITHAAWQLVVNVAHGLVNFVDKL